VARVLHAHAPAGEAAHDQVVGNLDEQRRVERALERIERLAERVRLLLIAREAVEEEAIARLAAADALRDHADDHRIRDEFAFVHVALRLGPERRSVRDLPTQNVAGRDVQQAEVLAKTVRLRALSGTWRAEHDEVQLRHDAGRLPGATAPRWARALGRWTALTPAGEARYFRKPS
jgi:hypothetical protein